MLLVSFLVFPHASGSALRAQGPRPAPAHAAVTWEGPVLARGPVVPSQARGAAPQLAPVALSLLVPGTGQLLLDRGHGWIHLALEAVGWVVYAERRAEGARYRTRYRDLAWEEARLRDGPRVDGDFPYYEHLTAWDRSGLFDGAPETVGVQPEADPATFNGAVWDRARSIFSVAPEQGPGSSAYQAALAYYERHAYGAEFLWDWSGDPEARERFAGWIRESDERFREATVSLGLLFANHLIAAADAWIASRGVTVSLTPVSAGSTDGARAQILVRWEPDR